MRKLLLPLMVLLSVLTYPIHAEYPNLYAVSGVLDTGELVAGVSSDLVGKYGLAVNVGRLTSGSTLLGLSGNLGYFAKKIGLDYEWGERTTKMLVDCARDFSVVNWKEGWRVAFLFTVYEM